MDKKITIKVINLEKNRNSNRLDFLIKGVHESVLNALRRVIISELEIWAVDDVEINSNTSIMPDEMLASRLALVPVRCLQEPSSDDTQPTMTMNITCQDAIETIYSSSIDCEKHFEIPFKDIPLVKLKRGQTIQLTAYLKRDCGHEHSKWSPTCKCAFRKRDNQPDVFEFNVESVGALTPDEIVLSGLEKLHARFTNWRENAEIKEMNE